MMGMPEGWYDDPAPAHPADPTTMRWWDGTSWTTRVRAATKRERAERREQLALQRMAMAGAPGAGYQDRAAIYEPDPGAYTPDGQVLAGWWSRVGAVVVDVLLVTVLYTLVAWPWLSQVLDGYRQFISLSLQAGSQPPDAAVLMDAVLGPLLAVSLISVVVSLAYRVVFLKCFAATPGKMALGLRVRRCDRPGPLSWGVVLGRCVGTLVMGWVPFLYYVDVLWPLWDARRQALHDKLVGTVVVRR